MTAATSQPTPKVRWLGGYPILETTSAALLAELTSRLEARQTTELLFANTNFVLNCRDIAVQLHGPDTLIVNDGIGMDIASLMLHGRRFPENLNGTDFTPRFLQTTQTPLRVYLLGSSPEIVTKAAALWSSLPSVQIVGFDDGFDGARDNDAILAKLRAAVPHVLLIAMGNPRQERWIVENRGSHGVPVVIGVGALFDFVAGAVKRAPAWMRRARLEWFHRLLQEPRRLLRRYSIDLVAFFAYCLRTRHDTPTRRSAHP